MFSKVITPLLDRLGTDPLSVNIDTFISARMRDDFPELDIASPGSVVRDLLISPLVLLLQPLKREIEFLRTQQSLASGDALTEAEMDALLSNVFSYRDLGTFAFGTVRVFFSSPQAVTFNSTAIFATAADVRFIPDDPRTYFPEEMIRSGNLYYLDIPIRSKEPDVNANVAANTIRYLYNVDNVIRVTNLASVSGGASKETNETFLERAQRSLSERSLNTKRGIETDLYNNFSGLASISVVGYGEPDMQRDILQASVSVDTDEVLGPMIYSTSAFMTHECVNLAGLTAVFPFTNVLAVFPPHFYGADTGVHYTWDDHAELLQKIQAAKYLRVVDGKGQFVNKDSEFYHTLSRVRTVEYTEVSNIAWGGDDGPDIVGPNPAVSWLGTVDVVYIKLADFDVYPKALGIKAAATPGTPKTDLPRFGFNTNSAQGSAFKLANPGEQGVTYGAPLPFTDVIDVSNMDQQNLPSSAIEGRDFFVLCSIQSDAVGTTAYREDDFLGNPFGDVPRPVAHPATVRLFPLVGKVDSANVRIGRNDGFLTSKERVVYQGKDEFSFSPNPAYSMLRERITVLDFGSPKHSDAQTAVKYGGVAVEDGGKSAGASLHGYDPGEDTLTAATVLGGAGEAKECDVVLHRSTVPWSGRNVSGGDHICLTLYTEQYAGLLEQANASMLWQAWGRIKATNPNDPHRIRVEGLDWTPLHKQKYGGFSIEHSTYIDLSDTLLSADPWHSGANYQIGIGGAGEPILLLTAPALAIFVGFFANPLGTALVGLGLKEQWNGKGEQATASVTVDQNITPHDQGAAVLSRYRLKIENPAASNEQFSAIVEAVAGVGAQANGEATAIAIAAAVNVGAEFSAFWATALAVGNQVELTHKWYHAVGDLYVVTVEPEDDNNTGIVEVTADSNGEFSGGDVNPATVADAAAQLVQTINVAALNQNPAPTAFQFIRASVGGPSDPVGRVLIKAPYHETLGATPEQSLGLRIEAYQYKEGAGYGVDPAGFLMGPIGTGGISSDMSMPFWYDNGHPKGLLDQAAISEARWLPIPYGGTDGFIGPVENSVGYAPEDKSADPWVAGWSVPTLDADLSTDTTKVLNLQHANLINVNQAVTAGYVHAVSNAQSKHCGAGIRFTDPNFAGAGGVDVVFWDDPAGSGLITLKSKPNGIVFVPPGPEAPSPASDILDITKSHIDYADGKAVLVFLAAPSDDAEFTASYNYVSESSYQLAWTVYRGERESITPDGSVHLSYDELAYAPAYKMAGTLGEVVRSAPLCYLNGRYNTQHLAASDSQEWRRLAFITAYAASQAAPEDQVLIDAYEEAVTALQLSVNAHPDPLNAFVSNTPYGVDATKTAEYEAVWIRLNKSVSEIHGSLGQTAIESTVSAYPIDHTRPTFFNSQSLGGGGAGDVANGVEAGFKRQYENVRCPIVYQQVLGGEGSAVGDPAGIAHLSSYHLSRVSLPFIEGQLVLHNASATNSNWEPTAHTANLWGFPQDHAANAKGHSGFLLPHPMGNMHYKFGSSQDGAYALFGIGMVGDNNLLSGQVVELYEGANAAIEDEKIVVSGIPGSVPFPGSFSGIPLTIDDNKVHIGGMTDVYLKPTSSTSSTSGAIKLQPEDPNSDTDVLFYGIDGSFNTDDDHDHFISELLVDASILPAQPGAEEHHAQNYVLEILDPPPTLISTFFRIVHTVPGGVRVDGTLGDIGSYENVRFRILKTCSTNLFDPLIILQQGDDLVVSENQFSAFSPSGFPFATDPALQTVYLSIDEGAAKGEYVLVAKSVSHVFSSTVFPASDSTLKYRIYTRQSTGLSRPLVRVKGVDLSGGAGVAVPYKDPVLVSGSSFSGLNDDPASDISMGTKATLTTKGISDLYAADVGHSNSDITLLYARDPGAVYNCLVVDEAEDFVKEGILKYDVVDITSLDAPRKHWYVQAITGVDADLVPDGVAGNNNLLVLDRWEPITGDVDNLAFVVGHPSIGTVDLFFRDPTYIEVGPDTVFQFARPDGSIVKLRPSPAEEAVYFRSPYNTTDITVHTVEDGGYTHDLLRSSNVNFFKHRIDTDTHVQVLTRVLKSGNFDEASKEVSQITIAGKTLIVSVDNIKKTVVFSGPNPSNLQQVVADINRHLGQWLRATAVEDPDNVANGTQFYWIEIFSSHDIEFLSEGTVGILALLNFDGQGVGDSTHPPALIAEYGVKSVHYSSAAGSTYTQLELHPLYTVDGVAPQPATPVLAGTISAEDEADGADTATRLFIQVVKKGHQSVFPKDLSTEATGLHKATLKVTSYDPLSPGDEIPSGQAFDISGHTSLGYELVVENDNYSYSMGEETSIKTTSIILEPSSGSFEDVYALPGASVIVSYDKAPLVSSIQSYLLGKSTRVVCNNPLCRHYFPAYPLFTINYTGGVGVSTIKDAVSDYMNTLYPNNPLEVFDLTSVLSRKNVDYVSYPQEAAFLCHDENRKLFLKTANDVLTLNQRYHIMEDMAGVNINKIG